jgi:hypothetical protein
LEIGLKVIKWTLNQEIDMTEWKTEEEVVNGVKHVTHRFKYSKTVYPTILERSNIAGVTLIINGYHFKCKSVEDAKIEAEDRLRTNRGIYLQSSN